MKISKIKVSNEHKLNMYRELQKEIFRQDMVNKIIEDAYRYMVIFNRTKNRRIKRKNIKKFEEMKVLFLIWSF